jgi:peptidoglycan/LPS O-acetylase OafA/YrhL
LPPNPSLNQDGRQHNNFDLLRLILAVLVILSHSFLLLEGDTANEPLFFAFRRLTFGDLAVNGFFLLSGYLIVQSWKADPRPAAFLKKRVLRIYPAFVVAALISALLVGPLGADTAQYFSELQTTKLLKSIVLLKVPEVPPTFVPDPLPIVNGSMWTIFFEFVCYMAVLLLGVLGVLRSRLGWLAITGAIFAMGAAQNWVGIFDEGNFYLPIIRLSSFFFAGGCFFLYREKIALNPKTALACLVLLPLGIAHDGTAELLLALTGGYLLFYIGFLQSPPALAWLRTCPDVSYGVYLYGWPVQKLLVWYVPHLSPWTLFPIAVAASLGLGLVSWYAIEKPFLRMKSTESRWKRRVPAG